MHDLVQSGRFAQLARLSRKALRLYAELGILRPAHVNADTGYRYYSLAQLVDAGRIAYLRELGMPLETIREALRVWESPELNDHLERHRQRLQLQAAQVQSALQALDDFLRTPRHRYPVSIKTVRAQTYLGLRSWCSPDEACGHIEAARRRIYGLLDEVVARPAGPMMARYHDEADDAWDIEVCVPLVETPVAALPRDTILGALPDGRAAFTVHDGECGGNFGMEAAYGAVWQWIHEHDYEALGGPYEVYLFDDSNTDDPGNFRTELVWMVR